MRRYRLHLIFLILSLNFQPAFAQRTARPRLGRGQGSTGIPSGGTLHHAEDEGKVEFRSETILVQVPVVVTDKSGAHLHGLVRDDFEVLENKKEQKISAFEEIESSRVPLVRKALATGQYSNLATGSDAPRTITLIALDTVNTPFLDQAYGRKQLVKYLADHVTPGQIIGLVAITGSGLKILHDFSGNPASLVQALKKLNGELPSLQGVDIDTQAVAAAGDAPVPGTIGVMSPSQDPEAALEDFITQGDAAIARMQQDRAIEITMRALLNLAHSVAGIPGRKSLVWATGSFPFYIDSPAALPAGYLAPLYEETMQALNDAQVSVYPIDVRGLVNYSPAADVTYRGNRSGAGFGNTLAGRSWLHNASLDTLREFAEMTGGKAFYNSNDIAGGFQRAADDSSSYYMLGYYLDTTNTKSGWRQLKVKVHKSGIEVRARSGFFVTNATMNPAVSKKNDIDMALASPFESTGLPVDVLWEAPIADGDKKKVQFTVHVGASAMTIDPGERHNFSMEFIAMAAKDQKVADTIGQMVEGSLKPENLAKVQSRGLSYRNSLHLAPGQYSVRFVVRDNLSGKVGSVSAPLTVN